MRPGMPPGRKHFRRSRDAPIYYGKGLVPSPVVKDRLFRKNVVQKNCLYLSRWQSHSKALDDGNRMDDSELLCSLFILSAR